MTTIQTPTDNERERRRPCGCPFRWRIDSNIIHLTQSMHWMWGCPDFPDVRMVPFDDVPQPRGAS